MSETVAVTNRPADAAPQEQILVETHPSMFRESPFWFAICLLLSLVLVGLIALGIWWIATRASKLTVTDKRVILQRGLLSKHTNEVMHKDIRNVQIRQSFLQRIFKVGNIAISSAGQDDIEIMFSGLARPYEVKSMIDKYRL